jgi:hypothetical protein
MMSSGERLVPMSDFTNDLLDVLNHWYAGQGTACYVILSSSDDYVPVRIVEDAAWELSKSLSDAKKERYRGYKKDDIKDLRTAIDMLNYIVAQRSKGLKPV